MSLVLQWAHPVLTPRTADSVRSPRTQELALVLSVQANKHSKGDDAMVTHWVSTTRVLGSILDKAVFLRAKMFEDKKTCRVDELNGKLGRRRGLPKAQSGVRDHILMTKYYMLNIFTTFYQN